MHPSNSSNMSIPDCQNGFDQSFQDDFIDKMLSSIPSSWTELDSADLDNSIAWSFEPNSQESVIDSVYRNNNNGSNLFVDDSVFLASKLRQHQISASSVLLDQKLLMSNCVAPTSSCDSGSFLMNGGGGDSRSMNDATISPNFNSFAVGDCSNRSIHDFYNGFVASLPPITNQPQHAGITVRQNVGSEGTNAPPPKQRVRARRGQATDPHSIAERLRRERIAERMRALQELVPNANKTDKASMLDEIIDYVKFLQLQVKVLSMSRLGAGVPATSPVRESDYSSEERGVLRRGPSSDAMAMTEHQVAKLMEEDMGSAMQYLQGKGLCLMPISLATAISVATCRNKNPLTPSDGPAPYPIPACPKSLTASLAACYNRSAILSSDVPASPNISGMTMQSTAPKSEYALPAATDQKRL